MFLFALFATVSRIPAEWPAYLLAAVQVQQPDNLASFQWVAIGTMGTVITGLTLYIRFLLAEIRTIERERHAHDVAVTEKLVTVMIQTGEAIKDVTEAMTLLANRLERQQARGRDTRKTNGKT
jgi:hypothetical protein